jgi:hypothetical protein
VRAQATLKYDEKILEGTTATAAWSRSTVRHYETARATITYQGGSVTPQLREDRCIVGVSAQSPDSVSIYCPLGPFNRDELDLLEVPANSALIDGLLPGRRVAVGESWKTQSSVLPAILGVSALSDHMIECTLDRIEKDLAMIHAQGSAQGSSDGVATELSVAAKFSFDVKRRRINWFAMSLKEKRSIGHAQPGMEATMRIQMAIAPRTQAPQLHNDILADLQLTADATALLTEFSSEQGGFELLVGRSWHAMVERDDVSILRMVDRGDLVAQCNISALPALAPQESFTIVDFQEDVRRALEGNFGEVVTATESVSDSGLHVMRLVVVGTVSDVPIHWVYYHLANEQGRRASCVFTYESDLADRFGAEDQMVTTSFRFLDRATPSSSPDTPQP